jgi:leucyl-tRNA synthetase
MVFKITAYKDRLIKDLEKVDYPLPTKKKQLAWLDKLTDWCVSRQRKWGCPIPMEGETDTLDTFVDSSFYTIEYDKTRPVDIYVGGNEHACAHLIYARFITKFLYDIGEIGFDEPFLKVIHQGMILGEDGKKMSKSKGNTVSPTDYDPQLLRMYLMFINHYFEGGKWQDSGYRGCERFRRNFNNWIEKSHEDGERIGLTEFKSKIIMLFRDWKTNRVVSDWMIFFNNHKSKSISKSTARELIEFFNICF